MPSSQEIFGLSSFPGYSRDTTSDMQSIVFPVNTVKTSFFTSHQMKPGQINPVYFIKFQPDWILVLFLLSFVLLAWIQVSYSKRLKQILLAPYSKRFLNCKLNQVIGRTNVVS